jgi:CHAT domain-containing protein/Flp pilus assembly protein TadD
MLTFLFASLLTAETAAVSDLCHKFVAALEDRDVIALHKLLGPQTDLSDSQWRSVKDLIEKFEHIHVAREEISIERKEASTAVVHLSVEGTSETIGAPHRTEPLPRNWYLQFEKQGASWRIRSAMTNEQRLAAMIVAQKDDAARRAVLAGAEFDKRVLPIAIASLATDGEDDSGADAVQFALTLSREAADPFAEASCLRLMSTVHVLGHNFAKAIESAEQSLAVARRAQSPDAECAALFTLGIAEWFADDLVDAIDHLDNAGALADRIEDPRSAIKSIYMAAYILQRQGHLSAAIDHAQRSQKLSEKYGWHTGVVDALLMTSTIHDQLQNVEIYSQLSRRAYGEAIKIDDLGRAAMAVYNLAEAQTRLGHSDRAIASLERVIHLPITEMFRASALDLLGVSLSAQHRYAEAEKALTDSLTISRQKDDRRLAQLTLAHLSDLRFLQGRLEEALARAREAIDITVAGEGGSRSAGEFRPWIAWTAEGRALDKLGRADDAMAAFRKAIDLIEESRQSSSASEETLTHYFRGNAYPYLALIDLFARKKNTEAALVLSEKIKGRTLRDAIERGRVDLPSLMTPEEKAHENELNHKIAELSRARLTASAAQRAKLDEAVQRAEDNLQSFTETLYLARTRATPAIDSSAPLSPPSLPKDAVILDYIVTEESTIVFTIAAGTAHRAKRLPITRHDLALRARRFARALERRDLRWGAEARQLYKILVAPVERSIRSKRVICIIPDDVLWQLPFEALVSADGAPLLEKSAIFYSPSLSFLQASARQEGRQRPQSLLAIGNPAGTAQRLPEAEDEVRSISRLYPTAKVFAGSQARETIVKKELSQFDVLHFATHAVIDDRSPMFSSLLLTADDQNDGLLQARELLRLTLRADLAVLSACQTGHGAVYPGEGVVGLSWAFLFAGCPASVVSRWMVNSRGTADVMVPFHRQLVGHNVSAAEALRRAELAVRRQPQYQHPYYWAAFQVVGVGW